LLRDRAFIVAALKDVDARLVVLELNNRGVQRAAGLRVGTRSTCRLDQSLTKPFDFDALLARMRALARVHDIRRDAAIDPRT